jgi:ribosome maturation factor RimP
MPETLNLTGERDFTHSQSFTLRVWLENLGEGHTEWRGKVEHIASGRVAYFRDWHMLIAFIQEIVPLSNAFLQS